MPRVYRGRRSYADQPPPTNAEVRAAMERIVQRHTDADEPDLELLPDPAAPFGAYAMVQYLLGLYYGDAPWRNRHLPKREVIIGDHREMQLLQRYIETRGALAISQSAVDLGVPWRHLADGTHIQDASTPQKRYNRLSRLLGRTPATQREREVEQLREQQRRLFTSQYFGEALTIARELVSFLISGRCEIDYDEQATADLAWVVEQVQEHEKAGGGLQLPSALLSLVDSLMESDPAMHSPTGNAVIDRARAWRKIYLDAMPKVGRDEDDDR